MIRVGVCHDDIFIGNAIVKEIKTIGIEMKEDLHVEIIEDFRRGVKSKKGVCSFRKQGKKYKFFSKRNHLSRK